MLLRRFRTLRIVATWCVRQTSPPLPSTSMKSKMARKHSSRSAKLCTWNGRPRSMLVLVLAADHPLGEEVDERVGLGVDVVPVEQHLGVLEHLAQAPDQRLGVGGERLVGAQRVEVHAVGLERREVPHVGERLGREAEPLVEPPILVGERAGLVEEAEVGALHVEADRRDGALLRGKGLEDAARAGTRPRWSWSPGRRRR